MSKKSNPKKLKECLAPTETELPSPNTTTETPELDPSTPKASQDKGADSLEEQVFTPTFYIKEDVEIKEPVPVVPPAPVTSPLKEEPVISGPSGEDFPNAGEELGSSLAKMAISSSQGGESKRGSESEKRQKQAELLSAVMQKKDMPRFERQDLKKSDRKEIAQIISKDQSNPENDIKRDSDEVEKVPVTIVEDDEGSVLTFDQAQLIRSSKKNNASENSQRKLEQDSREREDNKQ